MIKDSTVAAIENLVCRKNIMSLIYYLTCSQVKGLFSYSNFKEVTLTQTRLDDLMHLEGIRIFDSSHPDAFTVMPTSCKLVKSKIGRSTYKEIRYMDKLQEKKYHYVGNWVMMKRYGKTCSVRTNKYITLCGFFNCSKDNKSTEHLVRHMNLCTYANNLKNSTYAYMISGMVIVGTNGSEDVEPEIYVNMDSGTWAIAKQVLQYELNTLIDDDKIVSFATPHVKKLIKGILKANRRQKHQGNISKLVSSRIIEHQRSYSRGKSKMKHGIL
jgi:hypothetical protein